MSGWRKMELGIALAAVILIWAAIVWVAVAMLDAIP